MLIFGREADAFVDIRCAGEQSGSQAVQQEINEHFMLLFQYRNPLLEYFRLTSYEQQQMLMGYLSHIPRGQMGDAITSRLRGELTLMRLRVLHAGSPEIIPDPTIPVAQISDRELSPEPRIDESTLTSRQALLYRSLRECAAAPLTAADNDRARPRTTNH